MEYEVIIIGAGISGLSAASLLAKRGVNVAVIEQSSTPGGSCGVFKRDYATFDQGSAMLYGFGERGFNAHRFLFNCLEEHIEVIKHDLLYVVHYNGKTIRFWPDVDRFIIELSAAFPGQKENIRRFYKEMQKLYSHVISETPSYTTPDELNPADALKSVLRHPLSYLKFLSYMNISAEKLLKTFFDDPEILRFFDKLTSTYCYATVAEAPAIMASVMFIDNHEGGSYYPAGSTLFLPGKMEKVIEENGGVMYYDTAAVSLNFQDGQPKAVVLSNGESLYGQQIIYSGTVWNLYGKLLPQEMLQAEEQTLLSQIPTYPSVVLYTVVESSVLPKDTCPIEMIAPNPNAIDESEVTLYMLSIDDHTLCPKGCHTVIAIGPSFRKWDDEDTPRYKSQKEEEVKRLMQILDRRFPGFSRSTKFCELATPKTLERYTMKNNGAVAGPKQMLGQHMMRRQSIHTRWDSLFCCGESTTMGTGTPTVTTSGIAAANAVLKKRGLSPYVWKRNQKNYVNILPPPVEADWTERFYPPIHANIMKRAQKCFYCEHPACCSKSSVDIAGIMRRAACDNFAGAKALIDKACQTNDEEFLNQCQKNCIQADMPQGPVDIKNLVLELKSL